MCCSDVLLPCPRLVDRLTLGLMIICGLCVCALAYMDGLCDTYMRIHAGMLYVWDSVVAYPLDVAGTLSRWRASCKTASRSLQTSSRLPRQKRYHLPCDALALHVHRSIRRVVPMARLSEAGRPLVFGVLVLLFLLATSWRGTLGRHY